MTPLPEKSMIRAVLFDWGGVLIENPVSGLRAYIAQALDRPEEDLHAVFQDYFQPFQKGLISEPDLWRDVSRRLNVPVPTRKSLYREAVEQASRARPEVFHLAEILHQKGYKVGLLSNTEAPAMEYFLAQGHTCFDAMVFSCAEHCAKPEPDIYHIACRRLGVQPPDVVFIDDRPDYIQGAVAVGLRTILYDDFEQIVRELRAFGVQW